MKGFALWLCVASLLLTSCAATWTIRCTAPTQDNNGTCAVPILQPTLGGLVRMRLTWSGGSSGQDSLIVPPGTPCVFPRTGPTGVYQFILIAADSAGNLSCPDTLALMIRGRFHKTTDLRVQ
jgi:hypothetical protein